MRIHAKLRIVCFLDGKCLLPINRAPFFTEVEQGKFSANPPSLVPSSTVPSMVSLTDKTHESVGGSMTTHGYGYLSRENIEKVKKTKGKGNPKTTYISLLTVFVCVLNVHESLKKMAKVRNTSLCPHQRGQKKQMNTAN